MSLCLGGIFKHYPLSHTSLLHPSLTAHISHTPHTFAVVSRVFLLLIISAQPIIVLLKGVRILVRVVAADREISKYCIL